VIAPRGIASIFSSTITNNQSDADLNGSGTGGGVFNMGGATFNFQNSILAGNRIQSIPGECEGTLNSNGNNLMQVVNCTVNGGGVTVANPLLGPLQNNGGPTQTHALLAGSPAIDAGNLGGCRDQFGALLPKDQRSRRRMVDGNQDGTTRCDIGAYEFGSGAATMVDFDGDGETDVAVYQTSTGNWFVVGSTAGFSVQH
jgi:hypothetical protein